MKSRYVMVDTSGWVGLFLEGDEWHELAKEVFEELRRERRGLVTTTDVFDETMTALRRWGGHREAVRVGRLLRASRLTKIVPVGEELRERGWRRFEKTVDPPVSLTDCTSMAVMDELRVGEVFTFDDDFRRAGYETRPKRK